MRTSEVDDAVAMIRAGVDALLKADTSVLSSVELMTVVEEVEVERRRFEPIDEGLVAEVVARGVAGEFARTSPVDLLVERLRIRPGEAKARVTRADELGPRRDLSGVPLEPILSETAEAVASGAISGAHADVIVRALRAIPDDLEAEFAPIVEHVLVETARRTHPGQVEKAADVLLDRIDPDGRAPKDEEHQRRRDYGLRKNSDGSFTPYGRLTPEAGAVWNPILDTLGRPCAADDGTADPRSAGQRAHDAFLDAGKRLMRSNLPANGGTPVTLMVLMRIDDFLAGRGTAETSRGDLLSVAEILKQAADASVIPVVLSDTGGVLAYGKQRRLASAEQRLALAARDGGCSFFGCTRPRAWCETHHVVAYAEGGPTDVENMTLLCGYHHRNFEALGWACHMVDGVPMWTPPAWIDPERVPRRNTGHHVEIDFDTR